MRVNQLCSFDKQSLVFPEFPNAKSITSVLVPFTVMTSAKLQNDICYYQWQKLSKNIHQTSSVEDVYQSVWCPFYKYCNDLVDSLKTQSITLVRLVELFGSTESADAEQTINRLYSMVLKCRSPIIQDTLSLSRNFLQLSNPSVSTADTLVEILAIPLNSKFDWIKELAKKIEQWNSLDRLSCEADMFIDTLAAFEIRESGFNVFSKLVFERNLYIYCTYIIFILFRVSRFFFRKN